MTATARKKTTTVAKKTTGTAIVPFQQPAPQNVLQTLRQAALDKRVDASKMRELALLAIDLEKHANEKAFDLALTAAQAEIGPIAKNAKAENSRYLTLEKLSKIIDPIIHRHGFALSWGMAESHLPNHYRVTCKVSCCGHTRLEFYDAASDTTGPKGNANKTPIQGSGSAVSYARRYLKCMIFDVNVVNEDDDGNAAGGIQGAAPLTGEQFTKLNDKLEEVGADKKKFCEHFGIEGVARLPQKQFEQAMNMLDQKAKKKAAK